jgi:thymidylate synthase (FAD)
VTTIRLITEPTVIVLADMQLDVVGMNELLDWVKDYRPECVPDALPKDATFGRAMALFPHEGRVHPNDDTSRPSRPLTDNELLVELAGRECYHSYGLKAGRKTNADYIAHSQSGSIPHASIMYHAKMTFFLAGISRRVSHELIRHYVGADRSEEGSPSQESTRYTFHPGHFAVPPYVVDHEDEANFSTAMGHIYEGYLAFIAREENAYGDKYGGRPKGIDRKRIYEAAAGMLPMQACTSMVWTTNPMALAKLFQERCDESADLEFQRFANKWREIAVARWPNLFMGAAK